MVTLTRRVQGREPTAGKAAYIGWRFRVAGIETLDDHPCYRVDVECLAAGRVRPQTSFWCDQQTLFLRQFQTQVAVGGQYQTLQESYEPSPEGHAPVVPPINALPLGLPAFLPEGSKSLASFRYTSRPVPAGFKSSDVMAFAHETTQAVGVPAAKSLEQVPGPYAKDLTEKPVTEVRLQAGRQTIVQLWQTGTPWPLYTHHGRTQAWLVADQPGEVQQ